ncbi:MAG: hypothetical protein Q8S94_13550 [Pseudohongiella sp.]|nr:hypothetical protein [Pseudohongiella sp.]
MWSSTLPAQTQGDKRQRISDIIREYSQQGNHRTGSDIDLLSAHWMRDRLAAMGIAASLEPFSVDKIEVETARFIAPGFETEGEPLYDCHYSGAAGVTGVLSEIDSGLAADIGVVMLPSADSSPQHILLDAARRTGNYKAILVVNAQSYPPEGVAVLNAQDFLEPFGPPVLQIAHARWTDIQTLIATQQPVTLIASARRVQTTAFNVNASVAGHDPALPPVVVMTPRSGWWQCASERGGGIAAFVEIAHALSLNKPRCSVLFTANSGHELGHLGLNHFMRNNPAPANDAAVWIDLGANFAAKGSVIRLQFSDYELEELTELILGSQRLAPGLKTPIGNRPSGAVQKVFEAGGHFVSLLGSNPLLHHPNDVWPEAVDIEKTTRWAEAFTGLVLELSNS